MTLPPLVCAGVVAYLLPMMVLYRSERRAKLRVLRDTAVEQKAREKVTAREKQAIEEEKEPPPLLETQPAFLEGVGELKDYQIEGARLPAACSQVLSLLAGGQPLPLPPNTTSCLPL